MIRIIELRAKLRKCGKWILPPLYNRRLVLCEFKILTFHAVRYRYSGGCPRKRRRRNYQNAPNERSKSSRVTVAICYPTL